mgnify:CR=1 FL=1
MYGISKLGELYENLTLEEAIEKYESIPAERMNAVERNWI